MPILDAGTYDALTGPVSFGDTDIADAAATPIPAGGLPVILGHSAENDDQARAVGFILSQRVNPDNASQLLASGTMNDPDAALHMQEGGARSRRSPGLIRRSGKWQTQHLGLLGAHDPANPDLPPVKPEQVAFLALGEQGTRVLCLKARAHSPEAKPMADATPTATNDTDLKAQLAAATAEKTANEQLVTDLKAQLALKTSANTEQETRLAKLERESRDTQAATYIAGLKNMRLMPKQRADGTAILCGLMNGDPKVRLSAGKDSAPTDLSLVEAFKAFLASLVPLSDGEAFRTAGPELVPENEVEVRLSAGVVAKLAEIEAANEKGKDSPAYKAALAAANQAAQAVAA